MFIYVCLAPLVEPLPSEMPVLVESDVTNKTMTVRTPAVSDDTGEIRYIASINNTYYVATNRVK